MNTVKIRLVIITVLAVLAVGLWNFREPSHVLTIYSGRSENLVGPIYQEFTGSTGIELNVRYGGSAELAATILEEGENTPADIFFPQDAGALGALSQEKRLMRLPSNLLSKVDPRLKARDDTWIGITGRARAIVYNPNYVEEGELPGSIWGFTKREWEGRIGWSVTNGSFQSFVTALRKIEGDERAEEWIKGIMANNPRDYHNNTAINDGVRRGEVHIGFTNHYYIFRFLAEYGQDTPLALHFTQEDAGSIINIAGVGILEESDNVEYAEEFISFLLSAKIQEYFIEVNHEYPVVDAVGIEGKILPELGDIDSPDIDLSNLKDLQGTLDLLSRLGAL